MSLAVAQSGDPLWKDSSMDSAETKHRSQSLQPAGIMMHQQPVAQPATAATLEGGLIWHDSRQMTAENLMLVGQLQQQAGNLPFVTAPGSTLSAAAAATARAGAGCCLEAHTLAEELGSDEADFDMHGLPAAVPAAAVGSGAHGVLAGAEQQQGAAEEAEPIATKQFTASSKKQLTSKFRGVCWNKKNKRWQAAINSGGKYIYLGSFTSEGDAARQFDRAAIKIRGKKAKLNFSAKDYVDENGNLLEDFELPAPAGNGKPTADAAGSSKTTQPKLPNSSTPAHQQQQQLKIEPLAVDAGMVQQQCNYGSRQAAAAAADGGWQHQMLMMQQQRRQQGEQQVWLQQQQAGQQQQLWQGQQQQHLQHGQLPKARTWQEQLSAQQLQQVQAEQRAAAAVGSYCSHLAEGNSLLPSAAVHAGVVAGTADAPSSSDFAGHAALVLTQRRSGQQMIAEACSAGELHNSAAATGSVRQTGVTVTTSVGFGNDSSGMGSFAGMVQDMQQQHEQQMLGPELIVAELDLPPLVSLVPSSSMGDGNAMHMPTQGPQQQQLQQLLGMPSYGMQPNPQQQDAAWHQQQGAAWQQQQQQQQQQQSKQLQASVSGCPSALNTCSSTASAAQQYAQQAGTHQLQPSAHASASAAAPSGGSSAQPTFNSSSLHRIGSGSSAHASNMSCLMQQRAPMRPSMQMQQSSRLSGLTSPLVSSQSSGMGHTPAVTHALSARMASCDFGEAFQLARQAAAAQGVADLTGALRQMSSAQLPVVTTSSGSSFPSTQQQQPGVAQGAMASGGLLQYQSSALSVGVSSMGSVGCNTTSSGAAPRVNMQQPGQRTASLAVTQQYPAATAAGSSSSPTKHTHGCGVAAAAGCDAATGAPACKRARTSSLHDDGPVLGSS